MTLRLSQNGAQAQAKMRMTVTNDQNCSARWSEIICTLGMLIELFGSFAQFLGFVRSNTLEYDTLAQRGLINNDTAVYHSWYVGFLPLYFR